jgi:uroporphyrinogen decarboxylase
MRKPAFRNIEKVLRKEAPDRPTLFEFFLNERLYKRLAGPRWIDNARTTADRFRRLSYAFAAAGYDYVTLPGSTFAFPAGERHVAQTISLNEGARITDRASFEAYPWPDVDAFDYTALSQIAGDLPPEFKVMVNGPGGVLENVIRLMGYDNLCLLLADDPVLVTDIFDAVGSRLVRHYERALEHRTVGILMSNDDWGFKTQPMLAPSDMRKYVFPWHQRIVAVAHRAGLPAVLHSCGNQSLLMEDIITGMKYDAKHSFEDAIQPVEEAYAQWGGRIALLGGMDLDYILRSTCEEVRARSRRMLDLAAGKGGYALGTGNSVPEYVPDEKYFAMTSAVLG